AQLRLSSAFVRDSAKARMRPDVGDPTSTTPTAHATPARRPFRRLGRMTQTDDHRPLVRVMRTAGRHLRPRGGTARGGVSARAERYRGAASLMAAMRSRTC